MNIIGIKGESMCTFYKRDDYNNKHMEDSIDDEYFVSKTSQMDDQPDLDTPLDSNHEDEDIYFITKRPKRCIKPKQDYIISDIEQKCLQKAFRESILDVRKNKSNDCKRNLSKQNSASSLDNHEDDSSVSEEKIKASVRLAARKFASNFQPISIEDRMYKSKSKHGSESFTTPIQSKKRKYVNTLDFIKFLLLRGTNCPLNTKSVKNSENILQSSNRELNNKNSCKFEVTFSDSDDHPLSIVEDSNHSSSTTYLDNSSLTDINRSETSLTSNASCPNLMQNDEEIYNNKVDRNFENNMDKSPFKLLPKLELQNNRSSLDVNSITTINEQLIINMDSPFKLLPTLIPGNIKAIDVLNDGTKSISSSSKIMSKKRLSLINKSPGGLRRISPKIVNSNFQYKNYINQPNYQTVTVPINFMHLVPVGTSLVPCIVSLPLLSPSIQFNEHITSSNLHFNSINNNMYNKANANNFHLYNTKIVSCSAVSPNNLVSDCLQRETNKLKFIKPKEETGAVCAAISAPSLNSSHNIFEAAPLHFEFQTKMAANLVNKTNSSHYSECLRHLNSNGFVKLEPLSFSDIKNDDSVISSGKIDTPKIKVVSDDLSSHSSNIIHSEEFDFSDGKIIEAPIFHPTEEEFKNVFEYIQSICKKNNNIGMCKIVPPKDWKLNSVISEQLKITPDFQHIHKLRNRLCKANLQLSQIKKHLENEGSPLTNYPQICGVDVDLPYLIECVDSFGGLQDVVQLNKWSNVISSMRLPPMSNDRANRIYDIYCRYLLSYHVLSDNDKEKLRKYVAKNTDKINIDCLTQGRSKLLVDFYGTSKHIFASHFKRYKPKIKEIETEYNRIINEGNHHVVVQKALYKPPYKSNRSSKLQTLENIFKVKGEISRYLDKISDIKEYLYW